METTGKVSMLFYQAQTYHVLRKKLDESLTTRLGRKTHNINVSLYVYALILPTTAYIMGYVYPTVCDIWLRWTLQNFSSQTFILKITKVFCV